MWSLKSAFMFLHLVGSAIQGLAKRCINYSCLLLRVGADGRLVWGGTAKFSKVYCFFFPAIYPFFSDWFDELLNRDLFVCCFLTLKLQNLSLEKWFFSYNSCNHERWCAFVAKAKKPHKKNVWKLYWLIAIKQKTVERFIVSIFNVFVAYILFWLQRF